jgi:bla regulator protein BlaR1
VSFGMAIGGKRFQLLHRITRIINKENYKASFMENTVLFFTVISLSALGFISGKLPSHKSVQKNITAAVSNTRPVINSQLNLNQRSFSIANDTVPPPQRKKEMRQTDKNQISITETDGKKYTITKKDGEIESIMENGKIVAQEDYPKYEKIIRDVEDREALLENVRQEVIQKKMELKEKHAELLQQNKQLQDELLNNKLRMNEKMNLDEKMMLKQKMLLENNDLAEKQKEMKLLQESSKFMANQRQLQKKMEALQTENLKKALMDKNHAYLLDKEALMNEEKNQLLAGKMDLQKDRLEQLKMQLEFENKRKFDFAINNNDEIGSIIADLFAEKIIETSDPLSFTLNNKELIVNGKKQSEEVFNKLKERFIHNKSDLFQYSHNKNSTSTTINRE